MTTTDVAVLALRVILGSVFVAHGVNHAVGGGGLAGTARWFGSLGMRSPALHALVSVVVEVGAGIAVLIGLLTVPACGALAGVCLVALSIAHRRNGFFVFRDGYEYVLVLAVVCLAVALAGPGPLSVDAAIGLTGVIGGWWALLLAAAIGVLGGAGLLAVYWRPAPRPTPADLSTESSGAQPAGS